MTTDAVNIPESDRALAQEFDPDIAADIAAEGDDEPVDDGRWPQPDEGDVLNAQMDIDADWHRFLYGSGDIDEMESGTDAANEFLGTKGLTHIRDMRYQRDRLPRIYREKLSAPYRIRTRMTHNEILRASALATRPASTRSPPMPPAACRPTPWCRSS